MVSRGLVAVLCVVVVPSFRPAMAAGPVTSRLSVTEAGTQANGGSWWPSIDAVGRFVVFHSWADSLGPRDRNFMFDVYVRDRISGHNHLVSVNPLGAAPNQQSVYPTISADGLHVAFCSTATDLAPGPTHGAQQIYVSDWQRGVIERVSVSSTGEEANGACAWPAVSGDGRFVAFQSDATNLIPGGNPVTGVYLRDRLLGTTECISLTSTGQTSGLGSYNPTVSPDGRYVVFTCWSRLAPGDQFPGKDVYLRDRTADTLEVISVADGTGAPANGDSGGPRRAVSPDGRFVVFASSASNLVANDTNQREDVFVRDRTLGTTERVSVSSSGVQGNDDSGGDSWSLGISADGRFVVFSSLASTLVADDHNGTWDAFLHDRQTHTTTRLSVSTVSGEEGDDLSGCYGIATSAEGSVVVFDSMASLVPEDTNGADDVYLYDSAPPVTSATTVINNDAAFTTTPEVALSVFPGTCTQLRFRNEAGAWSGWEPAPNVKEWTLSSGDGVKRVSVQGRYADLTLSPERWDEIVLDRAAPSGVSVRINDDAAITETRSATLSVHAEGAVAMRFRNEADAWSTWELYQESRPWQLSFGDGVKRVSVQTGDGAGNLSEEAYDEIQMDTTPPGGIGITINSDAGYTNLRAVSLTVVAKDAVEMRFQNEGEGWSAWEPAAAGKAWILTEGDGLKRVYAQGRDAWQREAAATYDEITLDTVAPAELDIEIDSGAAVTASQEAALTFTGTDVSEIRLRDEGGVWTDWEAFTPQRTWMLPAGDGVKRVYVQGRDAALNETEETSDRIVLDTAPPSGVSLLINSGAPHTLVRTVALTVGATGAAEMCFRNEEGAWSGWEAFATTKQWALSSGRAAKTVWVRCRDVAGNVSSGASAGIVWGGFDDIPTDYWDYEEVMACVDAGIVHGFADNTYGPEIPVTRDQMAAYLARALAGGEYLVPPYTGDPTFPDVPPEQWAYNEIEYCHSRDIVHGYWDGYHPNDQVDRAQMAGFVARALAGGEAAFAGYQPPFIPSFPDVPQDTWAYKYVEYCHEAGIVNGYWDGYHPEWIVTRDQMAAYIARAFGYEMQ